jgi:nucleoside permease NupC
MKRKFNIFALLTSLVCGFALFGPIGLLIVGIISLIPTKAIGLRAGIFPEVWTGVMVNKLRGGLEGTFLDPIPSY